MAMRRCFVVSLFAFFALSLAAQQVAGALFSGLAWRDVGPMRGGRSYAVAGNPAQPDTYYMGSVGGGVWKTENAGRTWFPIADDPVTGIPIGSIGAIAVAPSDPNIVYVGTGEPDIRSQHSYGIGLFKSTDAGKTWHSIGLAETRQIGKIVVDPADPNRIYVAALGHVYKANPERGVYRSTDGGAHWKKILWNAKDPDNVGAVDLALDPQHPQTLYASLWATRRPPWAVYAPSNMPGSGLYKSADGGDTWQQLGGGLPEDGFVGKIGIAVAPSNSSRLYAVVDDLGAGIARPILGGGGNNANAPKPTGGIYRSEDGGGTWTLVNNEQRLWGRGWYFGQIAVDPANPDRAYDINTATYMTLDAGKTWIPVKGAPGGDDYHQLWINPRDGNRMVLSSDQGTVVSVDGSKSWSTWYNQPTAQVYHVAASNGYPYRLYGAQQDSGAVSVATWSRTGVLSFRDWEGICEAGESSTVVPDPKNGALLYGNGDQRCDMGLNVSAPAGGNLPAADPSNPNRRTWTLPQVFSRADDALYYANQFVFRSRDRGKTWTKISSDLTRLNPEVPKTLDPVTAKDIDQPMTNRFGVVYTIGPSSLDAKTVWVGTDDGLIHVTHDDGATWKDVTPPTMTAWSKVSQIEPGHFDLETAYASVDRHRLADDHAYIYRTHDGGKTWQNVASDIPAGAFVNSVKEDPKQKGLLYAATELRVYVSFDDGDHWQPLQLNMPVTSVRDIVVHDDDLAIATHGRGFWVLDQMAPLRQLAAHGSEISSAKAYLFVPGETRAMRQGGQNGTPLPHEEPQEQNPPAGVVAYYWLKSAPAGPLKLELVDENGKVAACLASDTPVKPVDTEAINVQAYWMEPAPPPSAAAGMHRAALNVVAPRGPAFGRRPAPPPVDACHPAGSAPAQPATAQVRPGGSTGREPQGLQPGKYTVRLTVDGQTLTQPVTIKPDPRRLPDGAAPPVEDDDDGE
jgi:photosystem II stability/assembly factor-like uncharacterized protein